MWLSDCFSHISLAEPGFRKHGSELKTLKPKINRWTYQVQRKDRPVDIKITVTKATVAEVFGC